jgi:alcohol dehydrogenase (NADP+)
MSSRTLNSAIGRISQVSQQLSSQAPIRQQLRMASTANTQFKLNTGASIPAIGFGTWQDKEAQESAVIAALKAGYRHIDTARIYGTEPAVGAAIRKSGVPRNEIFLVTKLWNNSHEPEDVEPALDASLKDLGTDYVDLYLMHWPAPFRKSDELMPRDENGKIIPGKADYVDTWKAVEAVFKKGKAKAIGVSNFSKAEMERVLSEGSVVSDIHLFSHSPVKLITVSAGSGGPPDGVPYVYLLFRIVGVGWLTCCSERPVPSTKGIRRLAQGEGHPHHPVLALRQLE